MERHKCKLCSRRFSSGRALGGHMRSHLANLPLPPKTPQKQECIEKPLPGGDSTDQSTSSLCSSEEEEEEAEVDQEEEVKESEEKALGYGLRENPKRSFRLVDPEFFDVGSVVQDRESETESTKKPTRRRSKRTRRMLVGKVEDVEMKEQKLMKPSSTESLVELEQVSSVSDTSPEEDLALCLIMLSRDVWTTSDDSEQGVKSSQTRGEHRCEICNKVFASSQGLGAHKISHKKMKKSKEDKEGESESEQQQRNVGSKKVHECPFCGKMFGSGQALGGHKRSHLLSSSTTTASSSAKMVDSLVESNSAKFQENLLMIDLNLPAPMEEIDQDHEDEGYCLLQEASPVSDADFINPINNH